MRPLISQKALQTTPEVRAFIYQQINEFETFLPTGSSVGVLLHEAEDHILATIEIHSIAGNFQCYGVGQDAIEALVDAKEAMVAQLQMLELVQNEDDDERNRVTKPVKIHKFRH
jgi:hypothetical protein